MAARERTREHLRAAFLSDDLPADFLISRLAS
jgi:hypothetical protein